MSYQSWGAQFNNPENAAYSAWKEVQILTARVAELETIVVGRNALVATVDKKLADANLRIHELEASLIRINIQANSLLLAQHCAGTSDDSPERINALWLFTETNASLNC